MAKHRRHLKVRHCLYCDNKGSNTDLLSGPGGHGKHQQVRTYLLVTKFSFNIRSLTIAPSKGRSGIWRKGTHTIWFTVQDLHHSPWIGAFTRTMRNSSTASTWTRREPGPAGPGAVHHHRGAQLLRRHAMTLQAPLEERVSHQNMAENIWLQTVQAWYPMRCAFCPVQQWN